jgi:hypothetical protein
MPVKVENTCKERVHYYLQNQKGFIIVLMEITFTLARGSFFFVFPENRDVRADNAFLTSSAARSDEQEFYFINKKITTFYSKEKSSVQNSFKCYRFQHSNNRKTVK